MSHTNLHRTWLVIFGLCLIAFQQVAAQAGHLDPTFGSGGIVTTDFGDQSQSSNAATANAVAIQSDGKIVVAGGVPSSKGFPVPAVARYNTNGSLDTSFGTSGVATIASLEDVPFTSVTLQGDGKIVAVAGGFTAYVVRYTSKGVLDSTFGTGGIVTLSFINGPVPSGVVIQPDDKIVVADRDLFRLLSDGQFDTSFGSGGAARTAGYPATGLALLPNGKILVASSFSGTSGFISQYASNGALDTTFGIDGQLASPGTANGVVLLSSGDFLAGGSLTNNSVLPTLGVESSGFAVSRYLGVGFTDATFGTNGGTVTAVPGYPSVATSGIAVQPSGDIVTLGTASAVQTQLSAFALARYIPAGQLDTTFGNHGTVITQFGPGAFVSANGLAIQPDSKIVVVGSYAQQIPRHGFDTAFKVVRYLGK